MDRSWGRAARAGISLIGLGAIWPEDIQPPTAFKGGDGDPLYGANAHALHFDKGRTPPNDVTWPLSIYDPEGWYLPNALNRFHIAPWAPMSINDDGPLDPLDRGAVARSRQGGELAAGA